MAVSLRPILLVVLLGQAAAADGFYAPCAVRNETSLVGPQGALPIGARFVATEGVRGMRYQLRAYDPRREPPVDLDAVPIAGSDLVAVPLGTLTTGVTYTLNVEGYKVATFVAGTATTGPAPQVPHAEWIATPYPRLRVREESGVVAYVLKAIGPRESHTYIAPIVSGSVRTPAALTDSSCFEKMGITDSLCFELSAIDRAGSIGSPTRVCGDAHPPGQRWLLEALAIELEPPVENVVIYTATQSLWTFAPWLLAVLAWGIARRLHAARRFATAHEYHVDRDEAIRVTGRLRFVLAGLALGATAAATICVLDLDHLAIALALTSLALVCAHAAWRAHSALYLMSNPDVEITTDKRSYLFLGHGDDLLRFVAMPRRTIARVVRELPAARVIQPG